MSSFINDTRGAAMMEGVIVLPVFVITLAALLYYHQAYTAKLESNTAARRCAWTYAVEGCVKVPDGCPIAKIGGEKFSGIDEGLGQQGTLHERSELGEALGGANSILIGLIGLREGIVATPSKEVKMPSVLGGHTRRIRGSYSIMCNERPHSFQDLVGEAYCAIGKDKLPGCDDD